jgi:hypothetical protein
MSAVDVLVLLLCVGLALRSATRLRQIRRAEPAESPRAESSAPRSSPLHEAAHLTVWPTHPFDRERMVRMLREGGHIDEARARELLEDA